MHLTFHILLTAPPANLTYALQKGSGSNFIVEQVQKSTGADLNFNIPIEIKGTPQANEVPDFKGPYVQGPIGGRFIYIGIGIYAGGSQNEWSGRLKIPLSGPDWATTTIAGNSALPLHTTVPGVGKKGMPNCATVKPFEGWKL